MIHGGYGKHLTERPRYERNRSGPNCWTTSCHSDRLEVFLWKCFGWDIPEQYRIGMYEANNVAPTEKLEINDSDHIQILNRQVCGRIEVWSIGSQTI